MKSNYCVSFPSTTTKDSTCSGVEEVMSSRSGYLPNIAQNFGYYKNLAINCLQRKEFDGARSALMNLNTSLGNDYLVNISTEQYEDAVKTQLMFQCSGCFQTEKKIINEGEDDEYTKEIQVPSEIPDEQVKVFDMILPLIASVVHNSKTIKYLKFFHFGLKNFCFFFLKFLVFFCIFLFVSFFLLI